MSIHILVDPYGVNSVTADGAIAVDTQDEYVDACQQINQAAGTGKDLRVVVRNKAMRTWFDQYRDRSGVSIQRCDPCDMLAGMLGVKVAKLPDALRQDPGAIVALDLVDLATKSRPAEGQSVASWALAAIAGSQWGKPSIESVDRLDDLLTSLARTAILPPVHPAIVALQQDVRSQWSQSGPLASVLTWLFDQETARRCEALVIARLMSRYPAEVRLEALQFEGRWGELCQLDAVDSIIDRLGPFVRDGFTMPAGPNNVIHRYLSSSLKGAGLKGILPVISGQIAEEEKVLRSYLRDKAGDIDATWEEDLTSLRRVFAQNEAADQLLEMVSELKPVTEPEPCRSDASWEEVSEWLETQYFPYYRWAVAVNRIEQTEGAVADFERWLINNYDALTRSDALLAACLRQRVLDQLKVGDCMLIIVDGLPWSLAPAYSKLISGSSLALLEVQPKVSVIPTITEIAKPCLVRGQLPGQLASTGTGTAYYHDLLSESIGVPSEEIVSASANEASLFELVRSRKKVMLYMFNSADEFVHKRLPADKRRERIEEQLSKLLEDISEARQEHRDQGRGSLSVMIVSDHGYTEMPNTVGCCVPTPEGLQESHGRVVFGAMEQVRESEGIQVIPTELVGGGTTAYAVTSGYNYFGSRPHGASHGGLTPQEVVVPLLVVGDQAELDHRDCEIAVTGNVNRGLSSNPIRISIVNPNDSQVIVEHLSLRLTKLLQDGPWTLRAAGRVDIDAEVDASDVRTRDLQITGSLTLRGPTGKHSIQVSITMETVGAAIADTRFDHEFDL